MLCSVKGCDNTAVHTMSGTGVDRNAFTIHLCDKHMPDALPAVADRNIEAPNPGPALIPGTATVVVDVPIGDRRELPLDHPLVKAANVVNTTNVSGTSGLTGPTEAAKLARQEATGKPKSSAESKKATVKVDVTPSDPQKV